MQSLFLRLPLCNLSGWVNPYNSSSSLLLSSLELIDTKVYEPQIRALLGTASHSCEAVVLKLRTVPIGTAPTRQPILYISNSKAWVDIFVGELTSAKRLWKHLHKREAHNLADVKSGRRGYCEPYPADADMARGSQPERGSICPYAADADLDAAIKGAVLAKFRWHHFVRSHSYTFPIRFAYVCLKLLRWRKDVAFVQSCCVRAKLLRSRKVAVFAQSCHVHGRRGHGRSDQGRRPCQVPQLWSGSEPLTQSLWSSSFLFLSSLELSDVTSLWALYMSPARNRLTFLRCCCS